jgi:hypothetical protein
LTALKDKVQDALDEGRILILGAQIIVGLLYRSAFEPGYDRLPVFAREVVLAALGLIVIAFGLLMAPVTYHRIVDRGIDREDFHVFVLHVMRLTLFPFALSLGLTIYVGVEKLGGRAWALLVGLAVALLALLNWYGLGLIFGGPFASSDHVRSPVRVNRQEMAMSNKEVPEPQAEPTNLEDKIRHVLTEARMVLPGAQALLGFQFVTMMLDDFDKLPHSSQQLHLVSLLLIALTTILLMAPAAYHRLVEKGENSERFHRFASCMVLAGMVPLGLGISGDFMIVVRKVTNSTALAEVSALLLLTFFYGLWFGYTSYRRSRPKHP